MDGLTRYVIQDEMALMRLVNKSEKAYEQALINVAWNVQRRKGRKHCFNLCSG